MLGKANAAGPVKHEETFEQSAGKCAAGRQEPVRRRCIKTRDAPILDLTEGAEHEDLNFSTYFTRTSRELNSSIGTDTRYQYGCIPTHNAE